MAAAAFVVFPGRTRVSAGTTPAWQRVPRFLRAGIDVPSADPRRPVGRVFRWAPVERAVTARRRPDPASAPVARVSTRTPEGTTNILGVVQHRRGSDGRLWVRARLAVLPNDATGWVPRRALGGYGFVRMRLVVDTTELSATLFRRGRVIFRAPVGVGQARWPTPTGSFYVPNKLTHYSNPAYGPIAFGTSARSATLTDWPAGGFIGIHGTDQPELLPGRVSHGCIRLANDDMLELARLLRVGTPVRIR